MRSKHFGLYAGLGIALAAAAAFADPIPMNLVQSSPPIKHSYPGVAIDVLGVETGMTVKEVEAIVRKEYGVEPQEFSQTMGNGIFTSQPYTVRLTATKPDFTDSIEIYFGTPATGNVAVNVVRTLLFQDILKAPPILSLISQMDQKYGAESSTWKATQPFHFWVFDKTSHVLCQNNFCPMVNIGFSTGFEIGNAAPYQEIVAKHNDLMIRSMFTVFSSDNSRAASLVIAIDDSANKLLNSQETMKQLAAATDKAKQGPAVAPKL